MRKILTVVLLITVSIASAQWTDIGNHFEDSLHIPVSTALSTQKNPIVLTSYPDGGYFVVWEDSRNAATSKTDIYAQKYDAGGNQLWAADGLPVAYGPNNQHYTVSSTQDYRNRSYATTDSAGGFYIAYADDSTTSSVWERVMVQHISRTGAATFHSPGRIIATSVSANLNTAPQLVADGKNGFFAAWKNNSGGNDYIYVYDYKDENGTLKMYGGGRVNENAVQTTATGACGTKTDILYPGTTVGDYNIWPDADGGCNVVMSISGNSGLQAKMLAYNRVWRAKADCQATTYFRNISGTACPRITNYKKGDVYLLYSIVKDFQSVACGGGTTPLYEYINYRLLANGFQVADEGAYDYNYPKGVALATDGNINTSLIAVTRRAYDNNAASDYTVQGYLYKMEKFDSIPYQLCSYNDPESGFNSTEPGNLNKLNFLRDTLLSSSAYFADFSLAAGGNHIYAAALMGTYGTRFVRLQNLELSKISRDSFALEYKTNNTGTPEKNGVAIGAELSTGLSSNDITYDHPLVAINDKGKGLFYIREYGRGARVSPIGNGAELTWGAMGKPISTGVYNNSYYNLDQPNATLDSTGATAFIAWKDNKQLPGNTGDNIFMRQLGKLDRLNDLPPIKKLKPLYNYSAETTANPAVLLGTSKQYSTIELYNPYNGTGTSPVVEILDNNYLGRVQVQAFQNVGTARRYNNEAYLNRNYTIKTDTLPRDASIGMLLYFTTEEFNALKTTDNTIADPGYLVVVRQPGTSAIAPVQYTPVDGEELITPATWDSVSGGYVIKITTAGFGNFFIKKIPVVNACNDAAASFTTNTFGTTYQWQVNTGNGFVNISDNASYNGTATATLQIRNAPAEFNGYLYHCVVDDRKVSNNFYVQVGNVWTGLVNNLWETAGNWTCNTVPDAGTDVFINYGGTVTINSVAACRSIKVNPGASVSIVPGFSLKVAH